MFDVICMILDFAGISPFSLQGPCGPFSGAQYWGKAGVTKIVPGWQTFVW
jgi:hypothetical protein